MEENNINFSNKIDKKCFILVNKTLLTQAFINILDNSIKYTKNTEHKKITLKCINNNKNLSITFEDNGDGI